ncbi:MAG: hypothetical protein JWQ43_2297 [Glaciihabitans sp.]|nr:hypothetical protein [Glaciihabitans sp.]
MAYVDAVARVQQIQATITQLNTRATVTSAAAFSTALSTVEATTGTASTASSSALGSAASVLSRSTGTATGGISGEDIVEAAKKYIGVPYVFGGEDASGMDCSGLVQKVLADLGIDAPRLASQQQDIGTEVASLAEAQPGDLIVTPNADHIVIYAGNNQIVHAPYAGRTVSLQDNYLTDADIQTIRRVTVPATEVAATAAAAPATTVSPQSAELAAILQQITGTTSTSSTTGTSTTDKVADLMAAAQLSMITGNAG